MDKRLISNKGKKSKQELADFLRAVADRIEAGTMTVGRGDDSPLVLELPDKFGFRFGVKDDIGRSGTQRKVQIGFRWQLGATGKASDDLTIS